VLQATSYSEATVEESDIVNINKLFKDSTPMDTMTNQEELVTRPKI
jgi:hypothetical protein